MSSTIFNTNINEIQTGRLLRSEHVTNIYRVLGGEINNIDNTINFTGSATFGQNNIISEDAIAPNVIFGSDNFIDAGVRNAIVMGSKAIGHVDDSLTLSSGTMILDDEGNEIEVETVNGDSQSVHYVRSLRVSANSSETAELPTRNRTITYFKLSIVGVDSSDSSNRGFYEFSFGFLKASDPEDSLLLFDNGNDSRMPHTFTVNGSFVEPEGVLGDVNLDGFVTEDDQQLVQDFVAGSATLTNEQLFRADVANTGDVTSFDAALILQYVNEEISTFPAGEGAPIGDGVNVQILVNEDGNPAVLVGNQSENITGWTINVDATETSLTPGIEIEEFPGDLFPITPAPD